MTTAQLKEYLNIILDLEKECYLQDNLQEELNQQISTLGQHYYYVEPDSPEISDESFGGMAIGFVLSILIGGFAGLIIGFFLRLFLDISPWTCPLVCIAILLVLWGVICYFDVATTKKNYETAVVEYKNNVAKDALRVQEEERALVFLKQELAQLNEHSIQTRNTLHALYSKNIIYPKYRNFVMVASIYEYFCSGRCTTLEGHEGAYNILEMELRLNRIVGQLDQVITLLDQIRDNQYMIYSAIQESNQKLDELISSSKQIESNIRRIEAQGDELNSRISALQATSTLNLYFNELTHKELSYRNRMGLR